MKVLIVEDHQDTRTMLEQMLSRWGHQVEAVEAVQPAVEAAHSAF